MADGVKLVRIGVEEIPAALADEFEESLKTLCRKSQSCSSRVVHVIILGALCILSCTYYM